MLSECPAKYGTPHHQLLDFLDRNSRPSLFRIWERERSSCIKERRKRGKGNT